MTAAGNLQRERINSSVSSSFFFSFFFFSSSFFFSCFFFFFFFSFFSSFFFSFSEKNEPATISHLCLVDFDAAHIMSNSCQQ